MFGKIPPVTRNLLIINFVVFLAQFVLSNHGVDLADIFGLHFLLASDFKPWQLFTYMFLHASFSHVFWNMFSLWMFGRTIEFDMGGKRFLLFYIICGVGAGFCQELWQLGEYYLTDLHTAMMVNVGDSYVVHINEYLNMLTTVGASGAIYGVLLAFGMLHPNNVIFLLFPPIPLKAKYMVAIFGVIELLSAFSVSGNVAHFAHLGGMLFAFLLIVYWRKHPWRSKSSFQNWNYWEPKQDRTTMQRIRDAFTLKSKEQRDRRQSNMDYDYNAQQRAKEARIDAILDKVKRSGYQSLTESEKRELFDNSN